MVKSIDAVELAARFSRTVQGATESDVLESACRTFAQGLGFRNHAFSLTTAKDGALATVFRLGDGEWNLPSTPSPTCFQAGAAARIAHTLPIMPFYWSRPLELLHPSRIPQSPPEEEGLRHGVTSTLRLDGGMLAQFSLFGPEKIQLPVVESALVASQVHWCAAILTDHVRRASPDRKRQLLSSVHLTARERECLSLCSEGLTTKQIAKSLRISSSTCSFHLSRAMIKLRVQKRAHAVSKALQYQLLSP